MIKKLKDNIVIVVLAIIAIVCYISVIYTVLTYGQVTIDSDVSLVYRFYKAVLNTKSIYPESWNAVNGEVYAFTRLPVNLVMLSILKNKTLAIVLSNALLFTVSNIGFIWLTKKFFGNNSWVLCVPAYSVFLCAKNARTMIFLHGAYGPMIIIFTFGLGLLWLSIKGDRFSVGATVIHSLMLFLMILGGKRHIAEYLLPVMATIVIYAFIINRDRKKRIVIIKRSTTRLLIPSALGYILYKYVCSTHNMNFGKNSNPNFGQGIGVLAENFVEYLKNLYVVFGYNPDKKQIFNILVIVICSFVCFIFPVMQAVEFKKLNEKEKAFYIFGIVHNIELLAAIVLGNMNQLRYLLSSIFILIIISSNYCYKKLIGLRREHLKFAFVAGFFMLTVIFLRDLLKLPIGWQEKYAEKVSIAEELEEHGITKGYASFWLAYPNEVYASGNLTFGAVDIAEMSFMKQYSNCDDSAYEYKEGLSCIVLSEEECQSIRDVIGDDFIVKMVEEPIDKFEIVTPHLSELYGTRKLIVYVFDEDICDRLTDGLRDGVLTPRELLCSKYAKRMKNKELVYMKKGGIIHGPYKKIAPGEYTITYKGTNLMNCDAYAMSEDAPDSICFEEVSRTNNEIVLDLKVSNYVEDVQFYLINNDTELAVFEKILVDCL